MVGGDADALVASSPGAASSGPSCASLLSPRRRRGGVGALDKRKERRGPLPPAREAEGAPALATAVADALAPALGAAARDPAFSRGLSRTAAAAAAAAGGGDDDDDASFPLLRGDLLVRLRVPLPRRRGRRPAASSSDEEEERGSEAAPVTAPALGDASTRGRSTSRASSSPGPSPASTTTATTPSTSTTTTASMKPRAPRPPPGLCARARGAARPRRAAARGARPRRPRRPGPRAPPGPGDGRGPTGASSRGGAAPPGWNRRGGRRRPRRHSKVLAAERAVGRRRARRDLGDVGGAEVRRSEEGRGRRGAPRFARGLAQARDARTLTASSSRRARTRRLRLLVVESDAGRTSGRAPAPLAPPRRREADASGGRHRRREALRLKPRARLALWRRRREGQGPGAYDVARADGVNGRYSRLRESTTLRNRRRRRGSGRGTSPTASRRSKRRSEAPPAEAPRGPEKEGRGAGRRPELPGVAQGEDGVGLDEASSDVASSSSGGESLLSSKEDFPEENLAATRPRRSAAVFARAGLASPTAAVKKLRAEDDLVAAARADSSTSWSQAKVERAPPNAALFRPRSTRGSDARAPRATRSCGGGAERPRRGTRREAGPRSSTPGSSSRRSSPTRRRRAGRVCRRLRVLRAAVPGRLPLPRAPRDAGGRSEEARRRGASRAARDGATRGRSRVDVAAQSPTTSTPAATRPSLAGTRGASPPSRPRRSASRSTRRSPVYAPTAPGPSRTTPRPLAPSPPSRGRRAAPRRPRGAWRKPPRPAPSDVLALEPERALDRLRRARPRSHFPEAPRWGDSHDDDDDDDRGGRPERRLDLSLERGVATQTAPGHRYSSFANAPGRGSDDDGDHKPKGGDELALSPARARASLDPERSALLPRGCGTRRGPTAPAPVRGPRRSPSRGGPSADLQRPRTAGGRRPGTACATRTSEAKALYAAADARDAKDVDAASRYSAASRRLDPSTSRSAPAARPRGLRRRVWTSPPGPRDDPSPTPARACPTGRTARTLPAAADDDSQTKGARPRRRLGRAALPRARRRRLGPREHRDVGGRETYGDDGRHGDGDVLDLRVDAPNGEERVRRPSTAARGAGRARTPAASATPTTRRRWATSSRSPKDVVAKPAETVAFANFPTSQA